MKKAKVPAGIVKPARRGPRPVRHAGPHQQGTRGARDRSGAKRAAIADQHH